MRSNTLLNHRASPSIVPDPAPSRDHRAKSQCYDSRFRSMWIVKLALSRPYTFVVMAVLIAILGGAAIATMPVDIFPYIDIPIVSIVWQYNGLTPEEMESRIVTNFERNLTSNVSDIEHIESQSYQTLSV